MFGLRLNWTCKKCATNMHDDISIVSIFEINGNDGFVKMACDKCGHIHYVNTRTGQVIERDGVNTISRNGTCAF